MCGPSPGAAYGATFSRKGRHGTSRRHIGTMKTIACTADTQRSSGGECLTWTILQFFRQMPIRIRPATFFPLVLSLAVAGCGDEITVRTNDRVFTLVGTLNAARWNSHEVPGSTESRPGTTLPAFLVCETAADASQAKAAAVIDRGVLTLHEGGTATLELTTGTWWKAEGATGASGGSVSEFGRWAERSPGTIDLSGFTTVLFNAPLRYTEAGSAVTPMTLDCPGLSSTRGVSPDLVFNRTR